ncbi:MAG TPA: TlpA disulfide reductase family protein [Candidatus Cloacimonadota bacterium]|nr:TlpA disulfide reductase family protein [Candidatus Cloacimonadota bacterium]
MKKIVLVALILTFSLLLSAEKAADFKLEDINGNFIKLSDLQKDGLVILDFWATWCVPCKNELPKLNELHTKYDNVTVVAISADKPRDKQKVVAHVKSNHFEFVTLFDTAKTVQKQFNVTNIPRTFIVAPDGEILLDHTGYQRGDEAEYEELIGQWLKNQQPAEEHEKANKQESEPEEEGCESSCTHPCHE